MSETDPKPPMIEINEIIRPLEQGCTRPFLCIADDGKRYVVKGRQTTTKQLTSEFVCAHLARHFDLPIPNFKIAYVDSSVIKYNDEAADSLGEGDAFASEFIDGLQEVNYQLMINCGQKLAADLFLFDLWVRNGDRTLSIRGGNPNVFYQPAKQCFWALDHNLAFDSYFEFDEFRTHHLGNHAWTQEPDLLARERYQQRAHQGIIHLEQIFSLVPDMWGLTDDFKEQIRLTLGQINLDCFWERI